MYDELIEQLRTHARGYEEMFGESESSVMMREAADAIEKMDKRIDFLMDCIYEAEDALDRGADNEWARAALEKAERGQDDV